MSFDFIYSNRFWSVVIGAIVMFLDQEGYISHNLMLLIDTILAGHVAIRTVDRFAENSYTNHTPYSKNYFA